MRKFILLLSLFIGSCALGFAQHSVTLKCTASTDASSTSTTNMYKAINMTCADSSFGTPPVPFKTGLDNTCDLVDTAVSGGTPYCYYATAVIGGIESIPSNKVDAAVPLAAPVLLAPVIK